MDRITQALTRIFDKNRIVFWYDAKKELRKEFETLNLPAIEKIELNNNEFGVKHVSCVRSRNRNISSTMKAPSRRTSIIGFSMFSSLTENSGRIRHQSG